MILDDYLDGGTRHGSEVSYNCPLCVTRGHSPDRSEKLWVNYSKRMEGAKNDGIFFCYRCEAKGSVDFLLRWLGVDVAAAKPLGDDWHRAIRTLSEPVSQPVKPPVITPDYTAELLQMGCTPVRSGSPHHAYLIERGVDEEDIEFYRMLCGCGRYHHRIIVPTFDFDRRIPFFVARSIQQLYFNIPGKGQVEAPKYLNPKGEGRKRAIFNLPNAVTADTVIVTEGVFSSIAAGRNAVATFGKLVTGTQIELLAAHARNKEIIAALDGDAHAQCVNLAARLAAMQLRVSFVLLPGEHDPATLSKQEFEYIIRHRYPYSELAVIRLQAAGAFKWTTAKTTTLTEPSLSTQFESSMRSLLRA